MKDLINSTFSAGVDKNCTDNLRRESHEQGTGPHHAGNQRGNSGGA
jgi:hypothetical protein